MRLQIFILFYTCLAVILIDFVFKKDESYYPQVFEKNYILYTEKENRTSRYITDGL